MKTTNYTPFFGFFLVWPFYDFLDMPSGAEKKKKTLKRIIFTLKSGAFLLV
jgi:hypothetical protein